MSFSLNAKNVLSRKAVKKEFLCALCQAILYEPMKCKDCKNHFHKACLAKFCKETGQCPMMCKKPKFVSIKKEIDKQLKDIKFLCVN